MVQAYAQSKDALQSLLVKAQAQKPSDNLANVDIDELREFILDESRYTVEAKGDYFLAQQMELQDAVFRALVLKKISIVTTDDEAFLASDHPVCLVPRPGVPQFYGGGGFLLSDVMFPINRRACLFLIAQADRSLPTHKDERIPVLTMKASPKHVREVNKRTIVHAEPFLFSSRKNEKVQNLFNETTVPTRMTMSSPFSRRG